MKSTKNTFRCAYAAVAGIMLAAPMVAFADVQVERGGGVVDSAFQRSLTHEENVRLLREQVELMSMKKDLAEIIYSCRQKGVLCKPSYGADALGVEYVGGGEAAPAGGVSAAMVPGSLATGGLKGEPIYPGDEGYDPAFDPNYAANADYASQPTYGSEIDTTYSGDGDAAAMDWNLATDASLDVGLIDIDTYQPVNGGYATDLSSELMGIPSAPELLGIENESAVFRVGNRDIRVKGGQFLPGKQWKVRSVEFNSVLMQGPDGESERMHLNWR